MCYSLLAHTWHMKNLWLITNMGLLRVSLTGRDSNISWDAASANQMCVHLFSRVSGSHALGRRVWGNAKDSDVTVILHSGGAEFMQADDIPCMSFAPPSTSCTSCKRPPAVGAGTRLPYDSILQLHSDQLCAASGYFHTALSTGLNIFCHGCRSIHLVMKGRQLEAAHHVLRFMYTNEVTLGDGFVADGMLYLWMIKVRANKQCLLPLVPAASSVNRSMDPQASLNSNLHSKLVTGMLFPQ